MNKISLVLFTLSVLFIGNINVSNAQISDIDGNKYPTVKVGNQEWMAANLNTSKFRNGDEIPQAKTKDEWVAAANNKQPIWAYIFFNDGNAHYGRFYNWYAVADPRGLAPEGWSIPTLDDWKLLAGDNEAAKIKSTEGWNSMDVQNTKHNPADPYSKPTVFVDGNGNNSTGFNAKPNSQFSFGSWSNKVKIEALYWTSTEVNDNNAYTRMIRWIDNRINTYNSGKSSGHMIRCVKK